MVGVKVGGQGVHTHKREGSPSRRVCVCTDGVRRVDRAQAGRVQHHPQTTPPPPPPTRLPPPNTHLPRVKMLNVAFRPILSATPAQNRRPPRFPADNASTYVDAKAAVTTLGRVGVKISLIMDFATAKIPCQRARGIGGKQEGMEQWRRKVCGYIARARVCACVCACVCLRVREGWGGGGGTDGISSVHASCARVHK
jgi:hypothetical protein